VQVHITTVLVVVILFFQQSLQLAVVMVLLVTMCQAKTVEQVVQVVEPVEILQQVAQVELQQPHLHKVTTAVQTHPMQMLVQAAAVEQVQLVVLAVQ
jgi:hypothetical protein